MAPTAVTRGLAAGQPGVDVNPELGSVEESPESPEEKYMPMPVAAACMKMSSNDARAAEAPVPDYVPFRFRYP